MLKDILLFRFLYWTIAPPRSNWRNHSLFLLEPTELLTSFSDFQGEERAQEQGNAISHAGTCWFLESDKPEVWLASYLESGICHKPITRLGLWWCSEHKCGSLLAPTSTYEIMWGFTSFSRCKAQSKNTVSCQYRRELDWSDLRGNMCLVWALCNL